MIKESETEEMKKNIQLTPDLKKVKKMEDSTLIWSL